MSTSEPFHLILIAVSALVLGVLIGLALLARSRREAHRRADEGEALLQEASSLLAIARVVGSATDLVEAFRLVSRELATLTGAETVSAYVLDRTGAELRPMAGYRIPREALPVLGTTTLPRGEQGFASTGFETGRPVWSDDVQNDSRFTSPLFRRFPHQSGLIIPLMLDGAAAGAFYLVWWKERRAFEASELAVIETIGRQVGVLLRNLRLHDALDLRATRLATLLRLSQLVSASLETARVLGEVARAAAELMGARVVHVWVVDESGATLDLKATSDPDVSRDFGAPIVRIDEGGIGQAVARREIIDFPDVFATGSPVLDHAWWKRHGLSSLLDVPIIHDDTVFGVLGLHGTRPFVLSEDDRAILEGFVTQAAVSLHHARSYETQRHLLIQTRQQQREALALETTAREIASSLAERELFARITERVRELATADVAFLATRDDASGAARVVATAGARTQAVAGLVLRPDAGAGRHVLTEGEIARIDPAGPLQLAPDEADVAVREDLGAQILVPLKVRDAVVGVLGAAKRQGKVFSPAQEAVLVRLADQSAIAINNLRLYEGQRRRGTRLEALSRVTRSIARSLDPGAVLTVIAQSLLDLFPDAVCRLWIVQDDHLVLGAEAGLEAGGTPGVTTLARGEGLVGRVVETREAGVVPDISASGAVNAEWMRAQRFVSAAVLPLVGEQCVGALAVLTRTRCDFPEDELLVLRAFAEHAAIAVEKAELYRSVEQRRHLIQRLQAMTSAMQQSLDLDARLAAFVREAPQAIGFDRVNVFFVDDAGETLTLVAGTEVGPAARRAIPIADAGALGLAWGTGEMVLVNDDAALAALPSLAPALQRDPILRTRRFAVVPLLYRGKAIGVVTADNKPSRRPLTEAIVTALQLYCQPLAQSVNNARLYSESERRADDERCLLGVAQALATTLDIESVLDVVIGGAVTALACDAAGFYHWDAIRDGLVLARGRALPDTIMRGLVLRAGEGLGGRAFSERRLAFTRDRLTDPSLAYSPVNAETMHAPGTPRAIMAAPLIVRDKTLGVLIVAHHEPHDWTERETNLLNRFTFTAAAAIENARLYAETRQSLAGAGLLNEAARTLHRTLDVRSRLPDSLATLAMTFDAAGAEVLLFDDNAGESFRAGVAGGELMRAAAEHLRRVDAPVLIPDTSTAGQPLRPAVAPHEVAAVAAFPVRGRSRVLGALALYFPAPRVLPDLDQRLVAAYADQLAMALDNAALFAEAENRRTQLEQVFASTSDGILVVDLAGRIIALNARGGELLGAAPSRVVGRAFDALVEALGGDAAWQAAGGELLSQIAREPAGGAGDLLLAPRTLRWQAAPTRDLLEGTVGLTVTLQDVTREREIDRMKSEFVSMVSHELRTPLTSIKGSLHLLGSTEGLELDADARELIDISVSNTDRLIRLINDILDISKIEAGRIDLDRQPLDVNTVVAISVDGIHGFAAGREIAIDRALAAGLPAAAIDRDRMVQVVTNLLSNAVKFSPRGARVRVETAVRGGMVEISVVDRGRGIRPEDLPKLFEKFRQLDASAVREVGGSGLGLAICRGIVEEHGGRIEVQSTPGIGSTFTVALPVAEEAAAPPAPAVTQSTAPLIVVVEDEPDVRRHICASLEAAGYRTRGVGRALEAVELARALRPALITMDVLLPDVDGFEAVRLLRIREETRDIPVVIVSAVRSGGDDIATAVDAFVGKPVDGPSLVRVVRRVLGDGATGARLLVVDDDADVRTIVALTLTRAGFNVTTADDGAAALASIAAARPALILLDLAMPGMPGQEVLRRLRDDAATRDLPVVVISASLGEGGEETLRALGVTAYLRKPFTESGLVETVRARLEARG